MISLAVKYRPQTWGDVTEQEAIKLILNQQLSTNSIQHAYLFCGGAGTGKTTCARIFANEINKHQGVPIEIDAASNSGVDDVREVIKQAQSKSLDSEYKIFIIDECHSISNTGWQAFLKLLEEPPAKSIFIFCTTDPQKIPKTILSRVQRYDFQRISQIGIVKRLHDICVMEEIAPIPSNGYDDALEYIAKLADGGMRDAISLMDKCLSYSNELTIENVVKALGVADYDSMCDLLESLLMKDSTTTIQRISDLYYAGKDLKVFIKQFMSFVLDVMKYNIFRNIQYTQIPSNYEDRLKDFADVPSSLLSTLVKLNTDLKWETSPKSLVEATLLLEVMR